VSIMDISALSILSLFVPMYIAMFVIYSKQSNVDTRLKAIEKHIKFKMVIKK